MSSFSLSLPLVFCMSRHTHTGPTKLCFHILLFSRFISLYHPTNLAQNKKEAASFIQSRLDAFLFLAGLGKLDRFSLSVRDTDEIVNAMDTGE